jgi:hypothetical protein
MSVYVAPKCRHWKPYTGPRSPTSRCARPDLSRNSRDALPSQILTPLACSVAARVSPAMNQSSSSATPRQKTRFVVSSGSTSSRSDQRDVVPNFESVPVPVRSPRRTPVAHTSRIASRYCHSSCRAARVPRGVMFRASPARTRSRYVANWKATPPSSARGVSSSSAKRSSSTGGIDTSHGTSASTRVR